MATAQVSRGARQVRRWMKFKTSLTKKRWLEPDSERNGPLTLLDLSDADDAADAAMGPMKGGPEYGWSTMTDSAIGGFSEASMKFFPTSRSFQQHNGLILPGLQAEGADEPALQEIEEDDPDEVNFTPFIRWEGNLDTRIPENTNVQRSGFCTIHMPEFPKDGYNLEERYDGIEIMCRTDGRKYSFLANISSLVPGDLYQCFINATPTHPPQSVVCPKTGGRFDRLVLLFDHFFVTSGGRMRSVQRRLCGEFYIINFSITLMDRMDGEFQFDLARIRAVNVDENGIIGRVD